MQTWLIFFTQFLNMASWDNRVVTNEHLLPYVDSNTAPPDIKAALQTLPFERNIFKVSQASSLQSFNIID